jgi:hypothetical protein
VRVRKAPLALAATYLAGLVLAITGPNFLPADYYYDAATIRDLLPDATTLILGNSYNNTALLYRSLGFGSLLPHALAGPLGYTLAFAASISASRLAASRWVPWIYALFALWNVPLAIFDGTYSKEVLAVLVAAAVCALARSPRGIAAAAIIGLAYALMFRTYWGIVLALWLTILIVWRLGGGWLPRMAVASVAVLIMSAGAHGFAGMWLSDGRTIVAEARELIAFSITQFTNLISNTSPLTDLLNTGIGWAMLLFPAFLIGLGGLQHIAFAVFQFGNTLLFARAAWRMRTLRRLSAAAEWQLASAASFCIAYTIVQGMFEPDFGSFAKHETTLLPMLLYVLVWAYPRDFPVAIASTSALPATSEA